MTGARETFSFYAMPGGPKLSQTGQTPIGFFQSPCSSAAPLWAAFHIYLDCSRHRRRTPSVHPSFSDPFHRPLLSIGKLPSTHPFGISLIVSFIMDAIMLHGLIAVESEPPLKLPSAPGRAVARTYPGAPQEAASIELQPLSRTNKSASTSRINLASTSSSGHLPKSRTETTIFSVGPELEDQSRPTTPRADSVNDDSTNIDGVEAMQSIMDPYMNRWRLLAMCLINLSNGMSDSAPGALIPSIEEYVPFLPSFSAVSPIRVLTSNNPGTTT